MPAPQQIIPSKDKDAAAVLVELLKPGAWIPPAHGRWLPVIEALLEAFLRQFDPTVLAQLLDHQRALPPSASAAERAARMAGELTALHKICQMLARNPHLPAEARAALAPLESLPPEAIPDTAVSAAVALAAQARPDLELDPENPKVARGSVADVFRFRDRTSEGNAIAFKTVRADSLLRIQNEAAILMRMAKDCSAVGVVAGPDFAAALAEALLDAAGALLREIDFVGEAANLRDARAFYKFNRRIRVPATIGIPLDRGIFMEFVEGVPLLDAPLDYESRRDAARLVFRRLVLDPLFSGLPQSIFHADPHAGNLMVQTQKHAPLTLVLLDWSQAGRLSAPLRHPLIALCLYCVTGDEPSPDLLTRLLESNRKSIRIPLPQGHWRSIVRRVRDRAPTGSAGPSSAAQPSPPAQILPDVGRHYAPTRPRFQCLAGNPRVCLRSVCKRSRRANLEHSIPVARPARFLSFRATHANARGSSRGHNPKKVCAHAKSLLARVSKTRAMFHSEAQESASALRC